jgi:hypothetical protein
MRLSSCTLFCFALQLTLLLVLFSVSPALADEDVPAPEVKAKWEIDQRNHIFLLRLTNADRNTVLVFPRFQEIFDILDRSNIGSQLFEVDNNTVGVGIVFTGPHPTKGLSPAVSGGGPSIPIQISPGETKTIKFFEDKDVALLSKYYGRCSLCLFWNKKTISTVPVTISGDTWKEQQ